MAPAVAGEKIRETDRKGFPMLKALLTTALVALSLLLTSCASSPTPTASSPATPSPTAASEDVVDTAWLLDTLAGQAPVVGSEVTAQFGVDGSLTGSGGCNRYRGTFVVSDGTIRVEDALAATMMACSEDVMTQESAFFAALQSARSYSIVGGRLTLADEAGKTLATFSAQSRELAASSWQVVALNNGQQAVVNVLDGTTLTIAFGEDGTVTGSSGCNSFRGPYTSAAGVVKLGPLASTMMACLDPEGVMDQEAQLVAALESAATYTIEGSWLEMRTADDATAVRFTRQLQPSAAPTTP